nr:probable inactive receptor kinase At5g67200 [Ipomoea trifida]
MGNWVISQPTQFYPGMERTAPSSSPPQALTQPSSQELPHKSTDSNSDTGNHNMEDVMCSPHGGNNEQVKENKMQVSHTATGHRKNFHYRRGGFPVTHGGSRRSLASEFGPY